MPMPSLTTYGGLLHDAGYDGMIVDMNTTNEIINMTNDQTLAIAFGNPVARSAQDALSSATANVYPAATCKAPVLDAQVPIGLAVRWAIRPAPGAGQTSANVVAFQQWDTVPILRKGQMYKTAAENVTKGDAVIMITANSVAGTNAVGGVTGGGAGAGRVVIPNCVWETTTTSGNIGIVRIDN